MNRRAGVAQAASLAGLLAGLVATLAAGPAVAAIDPDAAAVARSEPARAPWWAAFQEPALNTLLAHVAGGAAAEDATVRAYVEWRVAQVRLTLAGQLQQAASQQHAMLQGMDGGNQTPAQDDERRQWLAASTARGAHWQAMQQTLAGQRDAALATLAALTGGSAAQLREALSANVDPMQLPQVHALVPDHVAVANDAAAAQLQALAATAAQAQRVHQLVQADELVLRAGQLRLDAGAGTPLDVIEAYQRLVADNDRLADAAGGVAVAWARLLQSTGGRAAQAMDAASLAP